MMGVLNFFLGLSVNQKPNNIFICRTKYIRDLLKKYKLEDSTPAMTLMATATKLDQDKPEQGLREEEAKEGEAEQSKSKGNQNGNGNQNQNGQGHQLESFVWFERFVKQKPDSFSSTPTPIDAENWIVHLEKIFDALGCDEIQKVRLAVYKLEGDAQRWWRGVKATKGEQYAEALEWRGFKEVFLADAAKDAEKGHIDFRISRSNSGSKRTMDDQGFAQGRQWANDCTVSCNSGGGGAGGGSGSQQNPTARVFALTANQAEANSGTISGTLLVSRRDAYVLFDTGSTHFVVSLSFVRHLGVAPSLLYPHMSIATPVGNSVIIFDIYRECLIVMGDRNYKVNLLSVKMHDFDIILGMDWLSEYRATIDCQGKRVIFGDADKPEFVYHGSQPKEEVKLISTLKASKLLSKGCDGYLAFVKDTSKNEPHIEDYPVVREYEDVFPDELPGLPPHREVEFTIKPVLGVKPISKAPYRMAPLELQELK
ncbi:hypothetical protein AgCh_012076 [Apium graveolens]